MIAKCNKTKLFVSVEWGLGHPKYLIIYKKSVRNERVKKTLEPVLASVAVIIVGYRGPIPIAWTNDIVYERLAPGLLRELHKRNPTYRPRQRRHKHFQWLTEEVGEPKLKSHFDGILALMRAAPNWRRFKDMLNRAYPKKWDQLFLDFPNIE